MIEEMTDLADLLDVETLLKKAKTQVDDDVAVIILKINNPALLTECKSYDVSVFGKTLAQWTALAFNECPITEVVCSMSDDIISVIRPHLSDKKWTAVFYADTPLLQRKTFLNVLDWAIAKHLNVLKLDRGYVFDTEFIKQADKIYSSTETHDFGKEDFFCVFNQRQLATATTILQKRITDFHMQNGVQFINPESTFIDADVSIGKNVIVYPNNFLQGKTVIEDNVVLMPNNVIKNSKISSNNKLCNCVIEDSNIKPNSTIPPFSWVVKGRKKGNV